MSSTAEPLSPSAPKMSTGFVTDVATRLLNPDVTIFSAPFTRLGISVGLRMSAVRMKDGKILIYNPIQLDPAIKSTLDSFGPVAYVVAPNLVHHLYLDDFIKAFPQAKVLAPEGLVKKHEETKSNFSYEFKNQDAEKLDSDPLNLAANSIEFAYFPGFSNKEILMLHKPSGSLFCADMLWELPANEQYSKAIGKDAETFQKKGFFQSIVDKTFNTEHKILGHVQWLLSKNDDSFQKQIAKVINTWKPTTIIPEHGDVIENDAVQKFAAAFEWAMKAFEKKQESK